MSKKRLTAFQKVKTGQDTTSAEKPAMSLTDAAQEAESSVIAKTTAHEEEAIPVAQTPKVEVKPESSKPVSAKPVKKEVVLSAIQQLVADYPKGKEAYVAQVVVESVDKKLNFLASLYNVSKIELIHAAILHLWDSNKEEIEKDKRRKDKEENMFD